jgi:hypothetical protein
MRNSGNLLLASLSPSDAAALEPHLKPVHLEHEKVLFEAGGEVTDIYFPTGAIVSLVVGLSSGEVIEAAMVGKDGVVGASAALGGNIPVNQGIVQLAGPALMCNVDVLKSAAFQSGPCCPRCFVMSRRSTRRRASRLPAWRRIKWKRGFAAGCSGPEIWPTTIVCNLPKSSLPRCWGSSAPVSRCTPAPSNRPE